MRRSPPPVAKPRSVAHATGTAAAVALAATLAATLAVTLAVTLTVTLTGGACSALRAATTPPDFKQIARSEIDDAMHVMAAEIHALDAALRDASLEQADRQQRVVAALDVIAAQARNLRPPGAEVSHAMLQQKLPAFIREVESARSAAAATPPQYFLAGSVSGSCMACHRPG